jgi:outer membrane protein insertion porin family
MDLQLPFHYHMSVFSISSLDLRVRVCFGGWMSKRIKPALIMLIIGLFAGLPAFALQEGQPAGQPGAGQSNRQMIERIDIRGNRRIPEDTIRFYIQSRPGEVFDPNRIELDLRALYKSNFFENIEVTEREGDTGVIVTFTVKEKPLIREIKYEGNKSFTESNILEQFKNRKVGLTVDSQYDPSKIRAAERALKDLMDQNGKPLGTVRAEVENIPPSAVRVTFIMDEGPKVRIGEIRFTGDKVFTDSQLRGSLKLIKERNLITLFKGTDKYHKGKLEADIEMNLKAFYKEHGYMQVQVGEPLVRIYEGPRGMIPFLRKTKDQFLIEIPVDAGEQFHVGEIKLENCGIFKCEALTRAFGLNPGDVFNFKKVKDTLENFKKLYGNFGYINWAYIPEQSFDEKAGTMSLTMKFEPGTQFTVHRIEFSGNTKTRDKVIRREFLLEEGKTFSTALLDTSILRLNQLGFFDKIEEKDYEVKPNEKTGQVDITVKVKEKSQQSIGLTGGASGISGTFIGVNYTTNNFLGRGNSLQFSVMVGTRETDFTIAFTEPYLLDTRWTFGASIYNQRYRFDTYNVFGLQSLVNAEPVELFTRATTGVTFTTSRPLGFSFWRFGASYSLQRIRITNVAEGFQSFAYGQLIGYVPGGNPEYAISGILRSSITPMVSYNTTNNYFNPTKGSSLQASVAVTGGIFGGDFSMIQPVLEYRKFFPDKWISHGRNTFGFRILGQYAQAYNDSAIPFFDRFFIGGETTIRGFDIRSISPLAISSTPRYDAVGNPIIDPNTGLPLIVRNVISVGGDTVGIVNFEYRIPIAGPLSMAAFYDYGINRVSHIAGLGTQGPNTLELINSTNNLPRGSTGVEFQFMLPVISAPFRLIFAYNPQILDTTIQVGPNTIYASEPRHDVKFTIGRSF